MANNYYMQKQAAWEQAADAALIKQAAGVVDFIKNNPELVGALLGGTAGAGIGAATSKENRLLGALGGGALGAGVGAGGGYAARWLQDYMADKEAERQALLQYQQADKEAERQSRLQPVNGVPVQPMDQAQTVDVGTPNTGAPIDDLAPTSPLSLTGDAGLGRGKLDPLRAKLFRLAGHFA